MSSAGIEEIRFDGSLYALIVRSTHRAEGVEFLTTGELALQLAAMRHPPGGSIAPHVHNPVRRESVGTLEALVLKSGRMRVDFYGQDRAYKGSSVVGGGDVLLLTSGGHGFKMLEETEMIEVKQGPYAGAQDKTRFDGAAESEIRMVGANDGRN